MVRLAAAWTGLDSGREWTFPGLQLALFLLVFSIVWDGLSCRSSSLTDTVEALRSVYRIQQTRTVIVYAVPVILALLAIVQQARDGSGADFVEAVLNAGPKLVGGQ